DPATRAPTEPEVLCAAAARTSARQQTGQATRVGAKAHRINRKRSIDRIAGTPSAAPTTAFTQRRSTADFAGHPAANNTTAAGAVRSEPQCAQHRRAAARPAAGQETGEAARAGHREATPNAVTEVAAGCAAPTTAFAQRRSAADLAGHP